MLASEPVASANKAATNHDRRHLRVVLYSSGVVGLGHMRRSLLVAEAMSKSPLQPVILMLADARQAGSFAMPTSMDCITLPALMKHPDGTFLPRYLSLSTASVIHMRSQMLLSIISSYRPDILVVDNVPRGVLGELQSVLANLRESSDTRVVLGMRDVLDDPDAVKREWAKLNNQSFIVHNYDEVWVYGDRTLNDVVSEYDFCADLAAKIRYTGYLDQCERLHGDDEIERAELHSLGLSPGCYNLCLVGGGQDGASVAHAFAAASMPTGQQGLVVAGPFMPDSQRLELHKIAARNRGMKVLDFANEPTILLKHARSVVAMGGYNTTMEVLSFEKRALLIPRVMPRSEQMVRAERLRDMGLVSVLHPASLTSGAITAWLNGPMANRQRSRHVLDMGGVPRIAQFLQTPLPRSASHCAFSLI